jgi:oligosaccharide repeat unit polymerase
MGRFVVGMSHALPRDDRYGLGAASGRWLLMVELIFLILGFGLLTFFGLILTRSDYFNPVVAVPLMFLLCSFATFYNYVLHGTEVSFNASCLLLFTTMLLTSSAYLASRLVIGKGGKTHNWVPQVGIIRVPAWLLIFVILFCLVATVIYYRELIRSMASLGLSGDWNQMMNSYRFKTSLKEMGDGEGVSGFANFLYKLMTMLAFLFSYLGINNILSDKMHRASHLTLFIPAIIFCVCVIFTGGRMGLIRIVLGCALIGWVIFNARLRWTFHLKLSTVFKVILFIIVASVVFWVVGSAVGRQITTGPLDYITSYIGYSMVLFSSFLVDPGSSASSLFGSETFVGVYNFLGSHLGISDFVYTYHLQWRYIGDLSLGNVYTAYRYWLHDFGMFGMFVIAIVYGLFYGICYTKARCYRNKHHRAINYPLLMFSYVFYGEFLIPIKDCLLATEFVVTTPFVLIAMYVLGRYIEGRQGSSEYEGVSDPYKRLPSRHGVLRCCAPCGSHESQAKRYSAGGRD